MKKMHSTWYTPSSWIASPAKFTIHTSQWLSWFQSHCRSHLFMNIGWSWPLAFLRIMATKFVVVGCCCWFFTFERGFTIRANIYIHTYIHMYIHTYIYLLTLTLYFTSIVYTDAQLYYCNSIIPHMIINNMQLVQWHVLVHSSYGEYVSVVFW